MTRRRRIALLVLAAALALAAAYWCLAYGPRGLQRYPPRETSPYTLPFEGERWVCQGNNGCISHSGVLEFGYDFYMPQGTPVLCARPGVVRACRDDLDAIGTRAPANFVLVDHGDGTLAWYGHLRKGGVRVKPGERVERGQDIARSGWTGRAMIPHLHFEAIRDAPGARETIPLTFRDVAGDGIPRAPWFTRRAAR